MNHDKIQFKLLSTDYVRSPPHAQENPFPDIEISYPASSARTEAKLGSASEKSTFEYGQ
jgi:hypothetical protein